MGKNIFFFFEVFHAQLANMSLDEIRNIDRTCLDVFGGLPSAGYGWFIFCATHVVYAACQHSVFFTVG